MNYQEEIAQLKSLLKQTADMKEQAELTLKLLRTYNLINSKDGETDIHNLLYIAEELNSDEYRAWAYYHSGFNARLSGSFSVAIGELKKALYLFETAKSNRGIVVTYNMMGNVYYDLGSYSEALASHQNSLALNEGALLAPGQVKDKQGIASSYNNIGNVYFSQGQYAEALTNYHISSKLCEEIDYRRGLGDSKNNQGSIYYYQGNFEQALSCHLIALKIRDEMGDKTGIAASYNNIATVYFSQKNYPEALLNYEHALKIYELIGSMQGITTAHTNLGLIYINKGNYAEALAHGLSALKISNEIGDKYGQCYAYDCIGDVYTSLGNYSEALTNHLNSLNISEEIGEKQGIARASNRIGLVYTEIGDFDNAAKYLETGLKVAEETGFKEEIAGALEVWYKLKKAEGNGMAALAYHERLVAVQKELINEESARNVASMKYTYEVEKKEKELEIEQLRNVELKLERDRAEKSEKFKELFLANMSHEIRTPMNAVLGMTNLLLDTVVNEKQKNYLTAIKKSSENLLVILNDILYLSKLEAGKMELEKVTFRLHEQINHVVDILHFKAEEKGLTFSAEIAEDVPPIVAGDAPRLNQVLINILGNAIKFTDKGFVKLAVTGNHPVHFTISDSGIGMSAEQQKIIFQSFVQADNNTGHIYGGTGLGLSISKTLVELYGGKIELKSEPGKGSEFSFGIYLDSAKETDLAEEGTIKNTDYSSLSKIKILIAEDQEFNRIVIKDTLEKLLPGIEIAAVNNGREVIDKLKTKAYDMVLMDIHMPEMDGYEATGFIRSEMKNNVPILALTASVIRSDIDKCIAAGMNGYIPKPFTREELLNEMLKHLTGNLFESNETEAKIDLQHLQQFTKGKPASMLKYINMFLAFAPPLIEGTELALKEQNTKALYEALHALQPQLQFMGLTTAHNKAEVMQKLLHKHSVMNDEIKLAATQMCTAVNNGIAELDVIKKEFV